MPKYYNWELFVHDIVGKIERDELIPDPDWQRGYIWKPKDEQLLIDSLLQGLPIPKFYLTQEFDQKKGVSRNYVVDGQQRIKALHRFLLNKFQVEMEKEKYYFKDLDSKTQEKILNYKLNGHYMDDYQQSDINFLFQRLNRTGIKLTNMEVWNNEFYGTNVLEMIKRIKAEHEDYYMDIIYTEENQKRKIPEDDIIDICNCLKQQAVESATKRELETFLKNNKNISENDAASIESKFRKVIRNLHEIFSLEDLVTSAFSKRTHFISVFISMGLVIPKYYILSKTSELKKVLLDFIENQPEAYRESVLGGIRNKASRERRVKFYTGILQQLGLELDSNRLFDESIKQKFWRRPHRFCPICKKRIVRYDEATVDHIIPWAKGGKTEENNAQLVHKRCNRKKRDKSEEYVILQH